MLYKIYNNNNIEIVNTAIEEISSYKLKTVLTHLNMSTFDYDIQKDVIYTYFYDTLKSVYRQTIFVSKSQ